MPHVPIEGGAGLFPYENSLRYFARYQFIFYKHQVQGHHHRRVPELDQSVAIQLPSTEDEEGLLWNIWFKNMSVVEQF